MYNPFLSQAAGIDLDRDRADVAEINAEAFRQCQELIGHVRQHAETQAMLLFGEPGAGKTHLLGRLEQWLEESARQGQLSVFVPIRMASSARMLWRLMRERLAEALLGRREDGGRLLQKVVRRGPEEVAESNYGLGVILKNLFEGKRVAESAAWLKGHDLPPAVLESLGLAAVRDEEDFEAASERAVVHLCQEIAPVPVVFCLDQLESIQSHAGDKAGFYQFGKTISALYDGCKKNLAVISCLQTGLINDLTTGLEAPAADRLTRRRAGLRPLDFAQACRLAAARLDSVPEFREQRQNHPEPVWPLSSAKLKAGFPEDGLMVARAVIFRCSELFEQWQGRRAEPAISIDSFLERNLEERLRPTSEEESDRILRTGLPSLFRLRGFAYADPQSGSAFEGVLDSPPAAIAVANQNAQGNALLSRLKKLEAEWLPGVPALAVFRDKRRGIRSTASQTLRKLKVLEERGAQLIWVEPEALAALNALNELLADARSGDLALRGDSVPPATVEQWLANHSPPALESLLDQVGSSLPRDCTAELVELVNQARVVRLEEAAGQLHRPAEEVETVARHNPALFGFAGGSVRVLYRAVPAQTGR